MTKIIKAEAAKHVDKAHGAFVSFLFNNLTCLPGCPVFTAARLIAHFTAMIVVDA